MALEFEALPACRDIPGFISAELVKIDEEHHMMVVHGETADCLEAVSKGPGGAWANEHLRPRLSKSERFVGKVLRSPGV